MKNRLTILLLATFSFAVLRVNAIQPISCESLTEQIKNPAQIRSDFLKLLDRPKVPLEAKESAYDAGEQFDAIRFSFQSQAGEQVPGLLVKLKSDAANTARKPVVIVLHGTGGQKTGELDRLKRFAKTGFITVAIDGRFHGDRGKQADYNAAIAKAYADQKSHPLYFDTVWDVMRLIDYLQTRSDIDPDRIGLMGISKGGIETWLTSAADERVKVSVPCIGMQCFKWALENDSWTARVNTVKVGFETAARNSGIDKPDAKFVKSFYDHLIPGIDGEFDGPNMIRLICPRPLLIINGDKDALTPLPGLKYCSDSALDCYKTAEKPDHFSQIIEKDTGHKVNKEADQAALEWFQKWLKP
jgi:dienelactone hydrolase